jgi:uncharacterized membrane protein YfcA
MEWWWAYIGLGLFTGFAAGMLGIGGGLIIAPVLTFIYTSQGNFPPDEILHVALGTAMATIIFTSASSLRAHHQHQAVIWPLWIKITPGILAGTLLGTYFAAQVSSKWLGLIFTGFTCYVALQLFLNIKPKPSRDIPGTAGVLAVGTFIGGISALVSVGGAAITVPFLTWCNIRLQHAIGTSAAIGFPIAVGGTLGYIVNGWEHAGLPPGSLGFVYWPSLLWLVPASMLAAPLGARLTHRLPIASLKRAFACLIMAMAARMLWKLLF